MKQKTKKISIIAGVIALLLIVVHLINKIAFLTTTLKELLYREQGNFYNWRFGKVFYTKKGNGTPILLIHDLSAMSSHYEWKELSNELAKTHTVYTIDLLGCGRSDKPKMTYTNYLYVQLVSDFIKNVIKEKTDIISTRKSSAISIMSCYIDSQLFNNLILINPTDLKILNQYPHKKHKILKWFLDIPIMGTLLYNINMRKHKIHLKFKTEYTANGKVNRKYIDAFSEAAHLGGSASKYVYTSIKCHYTNSSIVHALKDINNSIYIIGGSEVPNINETISEYESYNPSIESLIIDNAKAFPHVEHVSECYETIKILLNAQ